MSKTKILSLSTLALALIAVATSMVAVQQLGTITLYGCAIDIRPGGQLETNVKASTRYEAGDDEVVTTVQLWVPDDVAVLAGDFEGGNTTPLNQDAVNEVVLTFDVENDAMTMSVNGGRTVPLPHAGSYDEDDDRGVDLGLTTLPDISETQRRARILAEAYGVVSGFTVRDA